MIDNLGVIETDQDTINKAFADDSQIARRIDNLEDVEIMQFYISKLTEWKTKKHTRINIVYKTCNFKDIYGCSKEKKKVV